MAHGAVKHDYHILPPSPWPFVGSMAATVMAIGLIAWIKGGVFGIEKGQWWLFAAGLAGVLYTMFGWWRDVIKEANAGDHTPVVSIGLRYGMVLFIASEVMFFVAWFWIFFEMALFHGHRTLSSIEEVRTAWAAWPPAGVETVSPWHLPLVNTLTLLLSGTTITWSHHALQQGDRKGAKWGLILTILLGALFTCIQVYEYAHINHENLFYSEAAANSGLYGSTFFLATGFHGFHVFVGTLFLIVCLIRLMNGAFTPKQHFGFEAAAWYWHFVDVVWLFLFAFIYVIFGASAH
ncbi:cytochrome c oxidase subunit 3 [Caulobacter flavus]|jgi:cytochrome c oxidase subunit III|uniref:cytochrome-c oxidase n=1 Tax=Caulobacter flavus TaxID=1679497 RepID=A0A2N5CRA1_9CAUL|nr:cytochrome c oxidase subunit 3 [Caulobacter flavus]AYV46076.1 cytochrome c oxidase subunit 3 [Caulobacter flavus]KSB88111.1 cytochrome B562 [Caulobacter vibrioides]PLR11271.1 cytochrome c oxidase subunit 3 [Caulobacter flavus]